MASAKQVVGAGVAIAVMVAILVLYVMGELTPVTPWTP